MFRIKFLIGLLANQRLPTGIVPNFYKISDALHDRDGSVYVDIGHLTEGGNEIVAKKLGDILVNSGPLSTVKSAYGHRERLAGADLR